MRSGRSDTPLRVPGFPIRTSTDRSLVGDSPWLFAASHVLNRLQAPRHPPLALCSLENKDARARYGILKELDAPNARRTVTRAAGDPNQGSPASRQKQAALASGAAPSKRNSEVRRCLQLGIRGRPGRTLEGTRVRAGRDSRRVRTQSRITSDRLGSPRSE